MKQNLLLRDDCLNVLKSLEPSSIDLALYDPPYNTGTKYEYDNNMQGWSEWMREIIEKTHVVLKDSGIMCVHISHHELFNLGMVMEGTFGTRNKLGIITWEAKFSTINNSKNISSTTEFILIFAKKKDKAFYGCLPRTAKQDARFNIEMNASEIPASDTTSFVSVESLGCPSISKSGSLVSSTALDNQIRPTQQLRKFGIMNPFNRKIYYPPVNRIWRRSKKYIWDELNKMGVLFREDENGNLVVDGSFDLEYAKKKLEEKKYPRIFFGEHGTTGPRYLQYLSEIAGKGRKMSTYWHAEDLCDDAFSMLLPHTIVDHNANATKLIYEIMGRDNAFNTPKPLKLTEMLIELFCPNDGNVLDCFAGSGTTGHAVLSTNKKLNRNRSFILVEKADYIESLTLERLNRVINGNWAKGQVDPLGGEVIYKEHNNEPSKNL